MNRPFLTLALLLALLPSPLLAEDIPVVTSVAETPSAERIDTESIHVDLHIRFKDAVIYSGSISLPKGSTASIVDSSGVSRSFPSDSALSALIAADDASPDFSVSPLPYYESFDSFYIECVTLPDLSETACGSWQYVINDSYPSIGTNSYIVEEGDSIYFYFGTPRKVILEENALASVPFAIRALSYDYTNDSWQPLLGATVGATRPNPDDPYNPIVVASGTSDERGAVTLLLDAIGTYGVGLAMDYYSLLETLVISAPPSQIATEQTTENETDRPRGSGSSSGRNEAIMPITEETIERTPPEVMISLDISIETFVARYKAFAHQA